MNKKIQLRNKFYETRRFMEPMPQSVYNNGRGITIRLTQEIMSRKRHAQCEAENTKEKHFKFYL